MAAVYVLDKTQLNSSRFVDKAIDCIHHSLLLEKLYRYYIIGIAFNFLKSYLFVQSKMPKYNINVTQGILQDNIVSHFS